MDSAEIYKVVQEQYGQVARQQDDQKGVQQYEKIAKAFGYSVEDLASLPGGANLGLSCGNPLAVAGLKEGETVIDLGSGAGFDVFLAAKKVGPSGKVIGIDMNKDMLARARTNAEKGGIKNVFFVESPITSIALATPDAPSADSKAEMTVSADCIISNCVVNLVPEEDKQQVFHEMFRLLKPGGRVAISDNLAKKELPDKMRQSWALYVGCIAGASLVEAYERYLKQAGFQDAMIVDTQNDINVYKPSESDSKEGANGSKDANTPVVGCCAPNQASSKSCCGPSAESDSSATNGNKDTNGVQTTFYDESADVDLNEWVGSYKIYAVKPTTTTTTMPNGK